jgi:hypothetical protein
VEEKVNDTFLIPGDESIIGDYRCRSAPEDWYMSGERRKVERRERKPREEKSRDTTINGTDWRTPGVRNNAGPGFD